MGVILNAEVSTSVDYPEVAYNNFINCKASSYDYGYDGGMVEVWCENSSATVNNANIHHNYAKNCCGGIEMGGREGSLNNMKVYSNVFENCTGSSVFLIHLIPGNFGINISDIRVTNNTIFANQGTGSGRIIQLANTQETTSYQFIFNNNIVYYSNFDRFTASTFTHNNNIFYSPTNSPVGTTLNSNEVYGQNPEFKSVTAPLDLSLKDGSVAINWGTWVDYSNDFNGKSYVFCPDAGAYETNSLLFNPGWSNSTANWSAQSCNIATSYLACNVTSRTAAWGGPKQNVTNAVSDQGSCSYYAGAWVKMASGTSTMKITMKYRYNNTDYWTSTSGTSVGTTWTYVSGVLSPTWSGTLQNAEFYYETTSGTTSFDIDECWLSKGTTKAMIVSQTEKVEIDNELNVYPNPVTDGYVTISMKGFNHSGSKNLYIVDLNGRIVYQKDTNEQGNITLFTDFLKNGMYFIKVQDEEKALVRKLIIK